MGFTERIHRTVEDDLAYITPRARHVGKDLDADSNRLHIAVCVFLFLSLLYPLPRLTSNSRILFQSKG